MSSDIFWYEKENDVLGIEYRSSKNLEFTIYNEEESNSITISLNNEEGKDTIKNLIKALNNALEISEEI